MKILHQGINENVGILHKKVLNRLIICKATNPYNLYERNYQFVGLLKYLSHNPL